MAKHVTYILRNKFLRSVCQAVRLIVRFETQGILSEDNIKVNIRRIIFAHVR